MRGKGGNCVFVGGISGITPAYAGKSRAFIKQIQNVWDHPRLCGEKYRVHAIPPKSAGSPPPMRGKGKQSLNYVDVERITPAYAGKSDFFTLHRRRVKDHPRLCGEKSCGGQCGVFPIGSPPPMRGKVKSTYNSPNSNRITPAYAGKRLFYQPQFYQNWDHPRLCGEKPEPLFDFCSDRGSPPPMRGKVATAAPILLGSGITPAYAGKSSAFIRSSPVNQDHPRLCGEKKQKREGATIEKGSPPPMRGKVNAVRCGIGQIRITPAYAGKREFK